MTAITNATLNWKHAGSSRFLFWGEFPLWKLAETLSAKICNTPNDWEVCIFNPQGEDVAGIFALGVMPGEDPSWGIGLEEFKFLWREELASLPKDWEKEAQIEFLRFQSEAKSEKEAREERWAIAQEKTLAFKQRYLAGLVQGKEIPVPILYRVEAQRWKQEHLMATQAVARPNPKRAAAYTRETVSKFANSVYAEAWEFQYIGAASGDRLYFEKHKTPEGRGNFISLAELRNSDDLMEAINEDILYKRYS